VGDLADVTGFPEAHERVLTLSDAEIKDTGSMPDRADFSSWRDLAFWSSNPHRPPAGPGFHGRRSGDRGTEASQDEYVLSVNGQLFTAFTTPSSRKSAAADGEGATRRKARVTGICMVVDANSITPARKCPSIFCSAPSTM